MKHGILYSDYQLQFIFFWFPIRKISFLCRIHIKQICKVVEKLFFRQQPIVAWVIAAVVVTRKSEGSIAVVIQTVALAAFQIASTVDIGVAISLPFSTLMGACAASWSSTSISTSCKNHTKIISFFNCKPSLFHAFFNSGESQSLGRSNDKIL